jgi:4-hydroxy-tetrahydrodipicolinate synthase
MTASIFNGTLPALMTPCTEDRTPDFDAHGRKAEQLIDHGMTAVIYAGTMGDWPLLTDAQRTEGVVRLVGAGIRSSSAPAPSIPAPRWPWPSTPKRSAPRA